jgi:serine/threonine protein kinase
MANLAHGNRPASDQSDARVANGVDRADGASSRTVPPKIPDHELLRCIGQGSYGEVWLARSVLGEFRAIKVVYRQTFEHERPYEREFEGIRKFEPISRLHDSQVDILHVGRNDKAGYFYYVMELADDVEPRVETPSNQSSVISNQSARLNTEYCLLNTYQPRTLKLDLYHRGRLPVDECISIGLALTTALEHLHSHGLVHRDVKPSNIIFVGGVPKLADIGLVASTDATMSFVGTSGFLPPEGPGTPQGDVYSLGKVLYEISMGQDRQEFPRLPPNLTEFEDPPRLLELNAVILKACHHDPRQRYSSAQEMAADLALLQRGKSVKAMRRQQQRWAVGKKAGLAVVLLALLTAGTLLFLRGLPDRDLRSANQEVNNLVAQGNHCVLSATPERVNQALDYFKSAIALDPRFAPAYFGLFRAYMQQQEGDPQRSPGDDRIQNLRATAKKLKEVAPALAETRITDSFIKWSDWQFPEALAEARSATKIRAGSKEARAWVHSFLGYYLLETDHPSDALGEYQLAERLLASDPTIQQHLGNPYFVQRRFKEALHYYQKSVDLEPRHINGHHQIASVYYETGDFMKAFDEDEQSALGETRNVAATKRYFEDLREAYRKGGAEGYRRKRLEIALSASKPNPYIIANLYARLGEKDKAYESLEKAVEQHSDFISEALMFDLCWDHKDEPFKAIARKVGLIR